MAVSGTGALVRAYYQSSWNRVIREAGFGGKIATWAMFAIVAAIVFLPCLFAMRLGFDLGLELAASGDAGILRTWNGLQATFTVAFALFGSFRMQPASSFSRLGRYPLSPTQLLVADLPAALFEVFPLLCAASTLFTNVGLAMRMPRSSPLVMLLALDGIVSMVGLMFIFASLRFAIMRRRALAVSLAFAAVAAASYFGLRGLRMVMKDWLPEFAQSIPLARGYQGLVALRAGDVAAGLVGIAVATGASALLILVAAQLHRRQMMREVEGSERRGGSDSQFRFGTPAAGVGRLFLRQLLGSRAVRAQIYIPLLYTGMLALISAMGRAAIADGKILPEELVRSLGFVESLPLYAIVPLLAIAMNPQIWMNQFGWDRGGLRTLLLLPMSPSDILTGKLRGLLGFTALQTAIAMAPLLTIRAPALREIVIGLAAGGVLLLSTTAVGHVVSLRFPRGIDGTAGVQIPLHLGWIAPVTLLGTGAELAGVFAIAELVVKGSGIAALLLSLAGAVALYVALLPRLAASLMAHRERLLSM